MPSDLERRLDAIEQAARQRMTLPCKCEGEVVGEYERGIVVCCRCGGAVELSTLAGVCDPDGRLDIIPTEPEGNQ